MNKNLAPLLVFHAICTLKTEYEVRTVKKNKLGTELLRIRDLFFYSVKRFVRCLLHPYCVLDDFRKRYQAHLDAVHLQLTDIGRLKQNNSI